jgi:hypothetical protein
MHKKNPLLPFITFSYIPAFKRKDTNWQFKAYAADQKKKKKKKKKRKIHMHDLDFVPRHKSKKVPSNFQYLFIRK